MPYVHTLYTSWMARGGWEGADHAPRGVDSDIGGRNKKNGPTRRHPGRISAAQISPATHPIPPRRPILLLTISHYISIRPHLRAAGIAPAGEAVQDRQRVGRPRVRP